MADQHAADVVEWTRPDDAEMPEGRCPRTDSRDGEHRIVGHADGTRRCRVTHHNRAKLFELNGIRFPQSLGNRGVPGVEQDHSLTDRIGELSDEPF